MPRRFAIVGAGKVGTALAGLLSDAGYEFVGAASRSLDSAREATRVAGAGSAAEDPVELTRRAELVFITTPDDAIEAVCRELSDRNAFVQGTVVAHCSGALPSSVLASARDNGAVVGSMHPLQTFVTAEQAAQCLPGCHCCIEGDPEAVKVLTEVADALGARPMTIPAEGKALYHAAAVTSCNYLVALQNVAVKLADAAGVPPARALEAFLPMVRATVENLARVGIPQSLTGPVARGDTETVRRHLGAVESARPELLPLYKLLGREAVEVALAKGTLAPDRAGDLIALFD